ncbi:MAG: hypothetical protein F4Y16_01685 [Holophagales bacterium]|nr:hypothetical protein [Holophagales bacterium]MYH26821.1 hypothetical protein [Holophagales bacterium]
MEAVSDWWGSLEGAYRVFYALGIVSALALLIQVILTVFGLDDIFDAAEGEGTSLLSMRTVSGFLAGFGWTGVVMMRAGYSTLAASIGGTIVGLLFAGILLLIIRVMMGLRHSGTIDYRNAVGVAGKVYAPIGASLEKPGQVEVLVQGRLRTVAAMTRHDQDLPTLTRIRVVDLLDQNTLLVAPLDAEADDPKETSQ